MTNTARQTLNDERCLSDRSDTSRLHIKDTESFYPATESELFPLLRAPGVWPGQGVSILLVCNNGVCVIKQYGLANNESSLLKIL